MSQGRTAATAAHRMASGTGRLVRAHRALPHERRLAAYAAIGLFLTMFLPWYQRQFFAGVNGKPVSASDSQTAWGAFSFVEAAVLLVAAGVLTLLFQRAEGRAFHIPGGDGGVITVAGVWTCVLVVWRIFDKQGGQSTGQAVISYGIEWGIFVALGVGVFLTYAGTRIRAAHRPEPPLPGEPGGPEPPLPGEPRGPEPPARPPPPPLEWRRARPPRPVPAQEPPTQPAAEAPRRRTDEAPTERIPEAPTERIPEASTQAARTRAEADDQLTIPFDEADS